MKSWILTLCLMTLPGGIYAKASDWKPAAGQTQIPIWPGKAPDAKPVPGPETAWTGKHLLAGRPVTAVTNVTRPTITMYAPSGKNTGAAVIVLPDG